MMSESSVEFVAFDGLMIARCCRDWPAVPPGQGGACRLCGKRPKLIFETYIGKQHNNEE